MSKTLWFRISLIVYRWIVGIQYHPLNRIGQLILGNNEYEQWKYLLSSVWGTHISPTQMKIVVQYACSFCIISECCLFYSIFTFYIYVYEQLPTNMQSELAVSIFKMKSVAVHVFFGPSEWANRYNEDMTNLINFTVSLTAASEFVRGGEVAGGSGSGCGGKLALWGYLLP